MKFKEFITESNSEFDNSHLEKFKTELKKHGSEDADLVHDIKLHKGKIHYTVDGISKGSVSSVNGNAHDTFDGNTTKYKSAEHAGKAMGLMIKMPVQIDKKEYSIFDKGHPNHKEWKDCYI